VSGQKAAVGLIAVVIGLLFVAGSVAETARADAAAPVDEVPAVPRRARLRLALGCVVIGGGLVLLGWMVFA
jgi:hypothetical protein